MVAGDLLCIHFVECVKLQQVAQPVMSYLVPRCICAACACGGPQHTVTHTHSMAALPSRNTLYTSVQGHTFLGIVTVSTETGNHDGFSHLH